MYNEKKLYIKQETHTMANIMQCTLCRKPFCSYGRNICPNCLEILDKHFNTVRDYLDEHPNACVETVSNATGVSQKTILYLVKEGRLVMGENAGGVLTCEMCKKTISLGRLCEKCKGTLSNVLDKNTRGNPSRQSFNEMPGSAKIKR